MTGYSYDTMKYEAQQHANRLADDAAAERLAREARGAVAPTRADGVRRHGWLRQAWAARLIHSVAHASIARVA